MSKITKRDKNKISVSQFMVILMGGLLSPIMEQFLSITSDIAPRGAFLAPLFALPFLLLVGYAIRELCGTGQGYMVGIHNSFCSFSGKIVLSIYIMWGILLLALRLQLCASSFSQVGYKEGAQFFLLPLLGIFLWWMTGNTFSSFGRASTLFFGALIVMLALVLGLSVRDVVVTAVLPFWFEDFPSIIEATFGVLGIFGYLIYGSFFLGEVEWSQDEDENGRFWISWCVAGCVILSVLSFVATGIFGASLLSDMAQPFFQLSKGIRIQGAFQRVESLVTSLWTFSDFIMMGLLLRATAYGTESMLKFTKKTYDGKFILGVIVLISTIIALVMPKLQVISGTFVLLGNLTLGFLLPFGLFFVKKVLHFPKKRGILIEQ